MPQLLYQCHSIFSNHLSRLFPTSLDNMLNFIKIARYSQFLTTKWQGSFGVFNSGQTWKFNSLDKNEKCICDHVCTCIRMYAMYMNYQALDLWGEGHKIFIFWEGGLALWGGGNYLVGGSYPSAYYDATKLEQRPQIFVKLSFRELCSLKLPGLHLFW